jgi:hypothetical protein
VQINFQGAMTTKRSRKHSKILFRIVAPEKAKEKVAHMLEEFIYFLLKNSIKQKQKSDSNIYETK